MPSEFRVIGLPHLRPACSCLTTIAQTFLPCDVIVASASAWTRVLLPCHPRRQSHEAILLPSRLHPLAPHAISFLLHDCISSPRTVARRIVAVPRRAIVLGAHISTVAASLQPTLLRGVAPVVVPSAIPPHSPEDEATAREAATTPTLSSATPNNFARPDSVRCQHRLSHPAGPRAPAISLPLSH